MKTENKEICKLKRNQERKKKEKEKTRNKEGKNE